MKKYGFISSIALLVFLSVFFNQITAQSASAAPAENPADYPIPYSNYPVPDTNTSNSTKSRNAQYSNPTPSANPGDQPFLGGFEFGIQYPAVLGLMAQNFKPGIGFHGAIDFNLLNDFRTALYVGYESLTFRADNATSFKVIPILAQIGLEAQTSVNWIYLSFDVGIGGAFGWASTVNANSIQPVGYFAAQIQPGLEFVASDMFSIVLHTPMLYLFSSKQLGYIAYDGGVKINL